MYPTFPGIFWTDMMCDERLIHWSFFLILGNVKYVGENVISKICGLFFFKKMTNL